jgi:hypothetical protein
MTFRIGEAFNLLFGAEAARPDDGAGVMVSYEERRWFRRPRPRGLTAKHLALWRRDAEQAEAILLAKIADSLDAWRANLRVASSGGLPERISERDPELVAAIPVKLDPLRHLPPRSPYDVFAISAYLVDAAGIYHHIQPEKATFESAVCAAPDADHEHGSPRHLEITAADRVLVKRVATAWRTLPRKLIFRERTAKPLADWLTRPNVWRDLEPLFESWAVVFGAYADADVFVPLNSGPNDAEPAPGWWKHVWRLFAIADEAARSTVFNFDAEALKRALAGEDAGLTWFEAQLFAEFAIDVSRKNQPDPARRDQPADITSLSVARSEILGVLPKVRTPSIGCTLRSLSHHLSLTPGRGVARGRWTPNFIRRVDAERVMPDGQMNILLAPFPYSIEARAFCGSRAEKIEPDLPAARQKPRFGYFDVHQHWLEPPGNWVEGREWRDELTVFVRALISAARRHAPVIHAIVFPELALNNDAFARIRDYLERDEPDIELFIAGVSEKVSDRRPAGPTEGADEPVIPVRHGNFVAVASFNRSGGAERRRQSIREKHHRWKLEANQLRDYGLLGVLSPELQWWENIALQSRRVDFTVIRQRSVLAAMICEDLARVDPCQQIIRSVAPNLVVALLMDAPQRSARWPSRYATVLAEDPGCAVLTVTSRALMTRQHRLGLFPTNGEDRIVAMWRDDKSDKPIELNCPYDAQGVLLTVVEEDAEDIALDGRTDDSAMAFRYAGHIPVRIPDAKDRFAHILGDEDRAC